MTKQSLRRSLCLTAAVSYGLLAGSVEGQGHDAWIGPDALNGHSVSYGYGHGYRGYHPRRQRFTPFEYHRMNLPPKRYLHHTDSPIYFERYHERTGDYWWYDYDAFWSRESFYPPNARPEDYEFPSDESNGSDVQLDQLRSPRFQPDAKPTAPNGDAPASDLVRLIPPPPGLGANEIAITFDDKAWTMLAEGDALAALGRFAAQRLLAPHSGETHVGYALAAAQFGDQPAAVAAMHDALRIDPGVLGSFPDDEPLRLAVRGAIEELTPSIESAGQSGRDAAFMCAALHLLLDENDAAADLIHPVFAALEAADEPGYAALRTALIARVGEEALKPAAVASNDSAPILLAEPISD